MDTSKIIKGVVSNGRYTVTAPIVKEDYGLYLQIDGVELPPTYQVDFSNSENNGTSVTMIGNADGVLIPHQFIDTGKDIFAFLYHVGANYGRTVYKFRIPNKVRPDRTDDEPTPEEQSTIDQLIGAMNTAVAQTAQDVVDAEASAQAAGYDADRAEEARSASLDYAEQAEASATSAEQSATASANSASASANSASASAQIKADVEELVDDAQASADASERSASNAYTYATSAERSSVNASSSAQSASGYASQAQSSAQTASSKASEASQSATAASNKATESAQSATTASNKATEASGYATASQTAQGLAESARDSAISAKNDAESARDDAESARDEAVQAVESISGALDDKADIITDTASGAVASFTDGADDLPLKSLVVNIDPVQDLHGQDAPYPAGGGKNKLNIFPSIVDKEDGGLSFLVNRNTQGDCTSIVLNGTATKRIYFSLGRYDFLANTILSGCPSGGAVNTYTLAVDGTAIADRGSGYTITKDVANGNLMIVISKDYTCNNLTFRPMVRDASISDATFAPYSNLCPISGWEGMQLKDTGKNLWGGEFLLTDAQTAIPSGAHNEEEKYFQFSSGASVTTGRTLTDGVVFKENTQYTFILTIYKTSGAGANLKIKYTDGTYTAFHTVTAQTKTVIMATSTANKTIDYLAKQNSSGSTRLYYDECGIFEGVLTEDDFEPFGTTLPISWQTEAGTVYGGSLDVLSGVLRVDRGIAIFDGTETFINNYFPTVVCTKAFTKGVANGNSFVNSHLPSLYAACSYANEAKQTFQFGRTNEYWGVLSADELKAIFAQQYANGTPVTICYPLATPIEIQLTPHEVNSLLGVNNIFADTGDTEVEYRANTKLYIERLTAPDSADMIADANITSGQYFMVGNSLYKATANIANGGQIIVGTNCTRVSLAQALNEINA